LFATKYAITSVLQVTMQLVTPELVEADKAEIHVSTGL
jgi:hypothetical protein